MPKLPTAYAWLANEPAPKMLLEALKLYGTVETPGAKNSPTIMGWADEVKLKNVYTADSVAWCGLFVLLVMLRAGKPLIGTTGPLKPSDMLWALNWRKWGHDGGQPELGDILVFIREGGGHVGFYIGEDKTAYHVLGGNQSDAVTFTRIAKSRLRGCRQFFATGKPENVRPIILADTGRLSINEA